MLAAVLKETNKLVLEETPVPKPEMKEVVVKVKSCGICATDYKAVKGIRKNVSFPTVLGHEISGTIAKTGQGVKYFNEGDDVIIMPMGYCGICNYCRKGLSHYCENAYVVGGDGQIDVRNGAFAEYVKTGVETIFHKPKNISFDAAALTEPLGGAWKGLINYSEMKVGDDVVIIGVGGIGLLCLMVAKAAGAGRLIAIDRSEYALKNALKMGATHSINSTISNVKESVYDIIPEGPDLIVEAAGPIQAVELMVDLRRRGTRWNIFGITTHEKFELDGGYTHFLEGRMDASFGINPLAITNAIKLMERNLVDPEKIISHRFPLEKIDTAMEVMGQQERNKVIINP